MISQKKHGHSHVKNWKTETYMTPFSYRDRGRLKPRRLVPESVKPTDNAHRTFGSMTRLKGRGNSHGLMFWDVLSRWSPRLSFLDVDVNCEQFKLEIRELEGSSGAKGLEGRA